MFSKQRNIDSIHTVASQRSSAVADRNEANIVQADYLICGIVVSYFPCEALVELVKSVKDQLSHIVVVDNGSGREGETILEKIESLGATLIRNSENLGVATALNLGVDWARANGFNWVLTLDQDSRCETGMVQAMLHAYEESEDREKIGILAPVNFDVDTGYLNREFRSLKTPVVERDHLMTSGNLIPIHIFSKAGVYDDDLFIDYVDHDFCLRVQKKGYKVILVRNARLAHRLGELRRHRCLGAFSFFSHNYTPLRRYYRARNRIITYRRYPGSWIIWDLQFVLKNFVKTILVEEKRVEKIKAALLGTIDGFLGRLGKADGATHLTPKAPRYFVEFREEIVPLLPAYSPRTLDLGCGSGMTSGTLKKEMIFGSVCGVEGNPEVAKIAREKLDEVLVGDLEKMEFPFEPESFDTILALDILEHLVDPWSVLERLERLLKPGGRLVISIPNIRHYSVVFPLLFLGDWRYSQEGILDSTHLRFFTRKTAVAMAEKAGFKVEQLDHTGGKSRAIRIYNRLTFGIFKEFFIFQNLIACNKPIDAKKGE